MKRIIIPFVAACSFLVSCSMDEIPQASVDKETVFNNESGLETYSYSFYNMLPSVSNGYKKEGFSEIEVINQIEEETKIIYVDSEEELQPPKSILGYKIVEE